MSIHFSEDFKNSVAAAVEEECLSRRGAEKRLGISVASAVRWCQKYGNENLARALGRIEGREGRRMKGRVGSLYEVISRQWLVSLKEVREGVADQGHVPCNSEAWRSCHLAERKFKGYSVDLRTRVAAAIEAGA